MPATGRAKIEPSVGASLAVSLTQEVVVQVFLPQTTMPGVHRARVTWVPSWQMNLEGTEVWADSAVSLSLDHRAAATGEAGEGDGGALVVLAQFN